MYEVRDLYAAMVLCYGSGALGIPSDGECVNIYYAALLKECGGSGALGIPSDGECVNIYYAALLKECGGNAETANAYLAKAYLQKTA